MKLLDLPADRVRVVQMETGGAFGGKEEYPSMIAAHAALLAIKSGKPVKLIYDRMEDMAATTKRHPSRTRHRTAVSKDGKILGGEIDFVIDGGAYKLCHRWFFPAARFTLAAPISGQACVIRAKAVATTCPRTAPFAIWRTAVALRAGAPHGPHRRSRRRFRGRNPAQSISCAPAKRQPPNSL